MVCPASFQSTGNFQGDYCVQIIIKHTRSQKERVIRLDRRYAGMAVRALVAAGATLWLLHHTVSTHHDVPVIPATVPTSAFVVDDARAFVDWPIDGNAAVVAGNASAGPMPGTARGAASPVTSSVLAANADVLFAIDVPTDAGMPARAMDLGLSGWPVPVMPFASSAARDFRVSSIAWQVASRTGVLASMPAGNVALADLSVASLMRSVASGGSGGVALDPARLVTLSAPIPNVLPAWAPEPNGLATRPESSALLASHSTDARMGPTPGRRESVLEDRSAAAESIWTTSKHWLSALAARWYGQAADDAASARSGEALADGGPRVTLYRSTAQRVANADPATREQLEVLARKIGELEARLLQLDALSERLANVAGVTPETYEFEHLSGGQGGPLIEDDSPVSLHLLDAELDALQRRFSERTDFLSVLDQRLTMLAAARALTPSTMPVRGYAYDTSSYGPRRDPFTRRRAFHEGIDFAAPRGTPILAAAGGIVTYAGRLSGYGNLVEIDHGNDLVTRYAHASKLLVKRGDLVYAGQKIATVGSTGRSTGPHLHFEVRLAGRAVDPRRFLAPPQQGATLASK